MLGNLQQWVRGKFSPALGLPPGPGPDHTAAAPPQLPFMAKLITMGASYEGLKKDLALKFYRWGLLRPEVDGEPNTNAHQPPIPSLRFFCGFVKGEPVMGAKEGQPYFLMSDLEEVRLGCCCRARRGWHLGSLGCGGAKRPLPLSAAPAAPAAVALWPLTGLRSVVPATRAHL